MADFLLELLSEEIPARMQAKASADLARLFGEQLASAGLIADSVETYATPRRLALIARGLPAETAAVSEELKGPRANAPEQAIEGFLRKTGIVRDALVERDGILFAMIDRPGRATAAVLAEAIPAIIRGFPWPKSMRWGEASVSTESLRWVRPLHGIVALLGEEIVDVEIAGIRSGAASVGHRFHHPGTITIGGAHDYVEKLRACRVVVDPAERRAIIAEGTAKTATAAGLTLVEDEGLVAENAGLTEWPVPLLGSFDPAFLDVPREVIQLTMRTNQKYFACIIPPRNGEGDQPKAGGGVGTADCLAPNFVCIANLEAADGGTKIVEGNRKVLAARLADARFFWEQDLKVPLAEQAQKLDQIVFHEKLGTIADKVDRVAKLARWLVEQGIVGSGQVPGTSRHPRESGDPASSTGDREKLDSRVRGNDEVGEPARLADMAERAARLCKADLVTQMVGEFPELQGVIGGHLARAQSEPDEVADAIRDHYKPASQADDAPTAAVSVAVSLADKLDTITSFFGVGEQPTGSRDPFALRRAALGSIRLIVDNQLRMDLPEVTLLAADLLSDQLNLRWSEWDSATIADLELYDRNWRMEGDNLHYGGKTIGQLRTVGAQNAFMTHTMQQLYAAQAAVGEFFAERLRIQQRDSGIRHDLIDAVFSLGEGDLVRLLNRVRALEDLVETTHGQDLLQGYKRAANILKKERWSATVDNVVPVGRTLPEEAALIGALDAAEPRASEAIACEDFAGAMAALASLRGPIDAFFDKVTVNDPDPATRAARLDLLARMRDAVHRVADFSRIEG